MLIKVNVADVSGDIIDINDDISFSPTMMICFPKISFRIVEVTGYKPKRINDCWVWYELYNNDSNSMTDQERLENVQLILKGSLPGLRKRRPIRSKIYDKIPNYSLTNRSDCNSKSTESLKNQIPRSTSQHLASFFV